MNSLRLQPRRSIARHLSSLEYGHAAAGSSPSTLDPPRVISMVLEGESTVTRQQWADALRSVVEANPGLRLRITGSRQRACWTGDCVPCPQVRFVDDCTWDGYSQLGLETLEERPLSLHSGPGMELIIATGQATRVILRVRHALMDGTGVLHFFQELFRALRGEPLLGTNAEFSDVDLMQTVAGTGSRFGSGKPLPLTGGARGSSRGDTWKRLTLAAQPYTNLMGQVAESAARYAWSFLNGPVRIAIPVDLRRHMPGLTSTMNYAGMVYVELNPGESGADFRHKLRDQLAINADTAFPRLLEGLRYLPLGWVDRLSGRTPGNYLRRDLLETVLISNLGIVQPTTLGCPRFRALNYYCLPVMGNSHITMTTCGAHLNFVVGMPAVYASEGRLERFIALLQEDLHGNIRRPAAA